MVLLEKFKKMFTRSSLANPTISLRDAIGGQKYAGVYVNDQSAMTLSAVYAATRLLAESVASLPLVVYRRTDEGKERAYNNPLYRLLHDEPNPNMTSFQFRETMMCNLCLRGNAYAEIARDETGEPIALYPIAAPRVEVEIVSGNIIYKIDSGKVFIDAANMLHIAGISHDGIVGLSPISLARLSIGLGIATEKHGAALFSNGAFPGGLLEYPSTLSDEEFENIKRTWNNTFRGSEGTAGVAILENGMTYKPLSLPNDDSQWLQTRQFQVAEIARFFRVPPHMIGDLSKSSFSNIEAQQTSFYIDSLLPHLVRWEQELKRKLFRGTDVFPEFLTDALLRADTSTRYAAYNTGRQGGWLSVNDIRERENMNRIDGGDRYLEPLNMTSVAPANGVNEVSPVLEDVVEPPPTRSSLEEIERLSSEHNIPFSNLVRYMDASVNESVALQGSIKTLQEKHLQVETLATELQNRKDNDDSAFTAALARIMQDE